MSESVAIDVLVEMGVLVAARPLPEPAAPVGEEHVFFDHTPCWAYEKPMLATPYADRNKRLFEELTPETPLPEVVKKAGIVAFLGAADTPLFRFFLQQQDVTVLIFEPDMARLERFAASVPAKELSSNGVFIFQGDLFSMPFHLPRLFPAALFENGFPVFYALPGMDEAWPEYTHDVVEYLELLFYRYRIYQVAGQFNDRGRPLRPMTRSLFYDQFLHTYENVVDYATRRSIRPLRNLFRGKTAILVAAGYDLTNRIEFIRANRDRCVVVAVNSALKTLLAHGIEPHFVVINDSSLATEKSFQDVPQLKRTALVGHCMSYLGGQATPHRFLFGSYLPEVFGPRPALRLYASVISTAFSVARYLGCSKCILAGAQLCSVDPYKIGYAKGSVYEQVPRSTRELVNRYPQLYPVKTPWGRTLYTSLNFRDAALWLCEEIRLSEVEVINLTRDSIIFGPNIHFDENPQLPDDPDVERIFATVLAMPGRTDADMGRIVQHVRNEMRTWTNTVEPLGVLANMEGDEFLRVGADVVAQLDRGNVSYLVQRFEDFDNARFHEGLWGEESTPDDQEQALRYYLEYVERMARHFLDVLADQHRQLRALAQI
jgi:hypothetical protein